MFSKALPVICVFRSFTLGKSQQCDSEPESCQVGIGEDVSDSSETLEHITSRMQQERETQAFTKQSLQKDLLAATSFISARDAAKKERRRLLNAIPFAGDVNDAEMKKTFTRWVEVLEEADRDDDFDTSLVIVESKQAQIKDDVSLVTAKLKPCLESSSLRCEPSKTASTELQFAKDSLQESEAAISTLDEVACKSGQIEEALPELRQLPRQVLEVSTTKATAQKIWKLQEQQLQIVNKRRLQARDLAVFKDESADLENAITREEDSVEHMEKERASLKTLIASLDQARKSSDQKLAKDFEQIADATHHAISQISQKGQQWRAEQLQLRSLAQTQIELKQIQYENDLMDLDIRDGNSNHFVFMLDGSGSMLGGPWAALENAMQRFVSVRSAVAKDDRASVICFDHSARLHRSDVHLSAAADLTNCNTWGGTSFQPPWQLAKQEVQKYHQSRRMVMVFMTDGYAGDGEQAAQISEDIYKLTQGNSGVTFVVTLADPAKAIFGRFTKAGNGGRETYDYKGEQLSLKQGASSSTVAGVFAKIAETVDSEALRRVQDKLDRVKDIMKDRALRQQQLAAADESMQDTQERLIRHERVSAEKMRAAREESAAEQRATLVQQATVVNGELNQLEDDVTAARERIAQLKKDLKDVESKIPVLEQLMADQDKIVESENKLNIRAQQVQVDALKKAIDNAEFALKTGFTDRQAFEELISALESYMVKEKAHQFARRRVAQMMGNSVRSGKRSVQLLLAPPAEDSIPKLSKFVVGAQEITGSEHASVATVAHVIATRVWEGDELDADRTMAVKCVGEFHGEDLIDVPEADVVKRLEDKNKVFQWGKSLRNCLAIAVKGARGAKNKVSKLELAVRTANDALKKLRNELDEATSIAEDEMDLEKRENKLERIQTKIEQKEANVEDKQESLSAALEELEEQLFDPMHAAKTLVQHMVLALNLAISSKVSALQRGNMQSQLSLLESAVDAPAKVMTNLITGITADQPAAGQQALLP